jgi:hypothetical protein
LFIVRQKLVSIHVHNTPLSITGRSSSLHFPFFFLFFNRTVLKELIVERAHRIRAEKPSKFRLNADGKSKKENLGNVSIITLTLPLAT